MNRLFPVLLKQNHSRSLLEESINLMDSQCIKGVKLLVHPGSKAMKYSCSKTNSILTENLNYFGILTISVA